MTELAALLRQLRRDGYRVTRARRGGHLHVRDKTGRLVTVIGSTPSDRRGLRNAQGQIRRFAR
jgi:predicted RNA binding protein YcfA (HicA-like mRNA interferase family)